MKYLAALKSEIILTKNNEDIKSQHPGGLQKVQKGMKRKCKNTKNTYLDKLQKGQKGVFTVFAVQEGSTFLKTMAQGYGCAVCGNNTYQAISAWETKALPQISSWTHEHRHIVAWKCESCSSVYEIIGGSKGPEYIN